MGEDETQLEVAEPAVPLPPPRRRTVRQRHWAMNMLGLGIVLALCYYAEAVLAVFFISVLLAFILAPIVDLLTRVHLPRGVAAAIAILLLLAGMAGVVYYSYNEAAILLQQLPKYTHQVREEIMRFRKSAENLEVLAPEHEKGVVQVRPASEWTDLLTRGFGSASAAILAGSFVPFLAYFMLTWHQHVRSATVMLFSMENRHTAYVALGLISAMIRSFMVGNLLIGLIVGTLSTVVFAVIHVPFFYFVGFISGFLSVVPYLGLLLALIPPVFVGLGHLQLQDFVTVLITVFGLHLIALNVLYPKLLGNRLQLNPLAVTLGLLVWSGLWGAMGFVLAIPITAAMKIVFDHVESLKPYGNWLGE
jgi:predicted PurR-regulated permease PerM